MLRARRAITPGSSCQDVLRSVPAVHQHMRTTGPHDRADGANRAAYVSHEWAWPTRDPSFTYFDSQTHSPLRLEALAGAYTCMRSTSSYRAGGM